MNDNNNDNNNKMAYARCEKFNNNNNNNDNNNKMAYARWKKLRMWKLGTFVITRDDRVVIEINHCLAYRKFAKWVFHIRNRFSVDLICFGQNSCDQNILECWKNLKSTIIWNKKVQSTFRCLQAENLLDWIESENFTDNTHRT